MHFYTGTTDNSGTRSEMGMVKYTVAMVSMTRMANCKWLTTRPILNMASPLTSHTDTDTHTYITLLLSSVMVDPWYNTDAFLSLVYHFFIRHPSPNFFTIYHWNYRFRCPISVKKYEYLCFIIIVMSRAYWMIKLLFCYVYIWLLTHNNLCGGKNITLRAARFYSQQFQWYLFLYRDFALF